MTPLWTPPLKLRFTRDGRVIQHNNCWARQVMHLGQMHLVAKLIQIVTNRCRLYAFLRRAKEATIVTGYQSETVDSFTTRAGYAKLLIFEPPPIRHTRQ